MANEHNSKTHASSEHTVSVGIYLLIGITLLILTGATTAIAFVNLGPFNAAVALTIATIKALLVILFFMHVKYTHEKMTRAVVVSGFFFLAILLALSMSDYMTRAWR